MNEQIVAKRLTVPMVDTGTSSNGLEEGTNESASGATPSASFRLPLGSTIPETLLQTFILKVWQRLLGRTDVGLDEDFIEAGGTPLLKRQMILAVEKATRQQTAVSFLAGRCTIRNVEAALLRGDVSATELMSVVKAGYGSPLLFCHGDYATQGLYVRKLAELLNCDGPIFSLHPYPNPNPRVTIQEMAQAYLPDLLLRHPTGVFHLVGYCNGAQLAWEIAHQLQNLGRQVEFLVLIEAISLNARPILSGFARATSICIAITPKFVGDWLARNLMHLVWSTFSRQIPTPYSQALQNYVPPKLKTRAVCVISEDSYNQFIYSPSPWGRLCPHFDCKRIRGNHQNGLAILSSELVPLLDQLLSEDSMQRGRR